MNYTIKQGNNIDILKQYTDNHFDSIVTDPPYGIEFLGKDWDSNTGAIETWKECYRVLKPGGHLLAFSAARTYHHLATNIENCGFEIRDQLMWIYASGFPKAQDIGKALDKRGIDNEWSGWKTALKPGHEPIVMARKPFKGSAIDNVLAHGTGALNIDATRIGVDNNEKKAFQSNWDRECAGAASYAKLDGSVAYGTKMNEADKETYSQYKPEGRFPSNVMGDIPDYQKYFYCPKVSRAERHCGFEQNNIPAPFGDVKGAYQDGERFAAKHQKLQGNYTQDGTLGRMKDNYSKGSLDHIITKDATNGGNYMNTTTHPTDPKLQGNIISTEDMIQAMGGKLITNNRVWTPDLGEFYIHGLKEEYIKWCEKNNKATGSMGNNHPTVKPVALMRYLIQLVTPKGGSVLDPFTGSGSTGMAAVEADMCFTGCELDPNYVAIANKRIEAWYTRTQPDNNFKELFD